ncbi:uncharacterized protein UBRO_20935 [Ustilago bromivora]|uniref:Uncharacterized protein n=1 Tax=Ustilago bromivora TaxID=307758 RepID=A0A1K0GY28_9BASI|nr:uncharacterized protein UBRO_20935 [Ustilago bromivora]
MVSSHMDPDLLRIRSYDSQLALERERAELEGLRADAENFNALKSGHDGSSTSATQRLQGEKLELETELVRQKQQSEKELKAREAELRQLRLRLDQVTGTTRGSDDAEPGSAVSDASLRSPNDIKRKDAHRLSVMSNSSVSSNLKSSHRVSSNGAYATSDVSTISSANQMSGLSYLVRQLSEENNEMKTKHKLLESDLEARAQEAETKSRALELTVQSLGKHSMLASQHQTNTHLYYANVPAQNDTSSSWTKSWMLKITIQ